MTKISAPTRMATSPRSGNSKNNDNDSSPCGLATLWIRGLLVLAAIGLFVVLMTSQQKSTADKVVSLAEPDNTVAVKMAGGTSAGHLLQGAVGDVSYYHCAASSSSSRHVILLHGARFTKQDWKRSTIMEKLCHVDNLSVTALDLPVSADANQLQSVLQSLVNNGVVPPNGNYVLVTPSASGKAVVDWINTGNLQELQKTIGLWIPIASPAIAKAKVEKLQALHDDSWKIVALYGSQDAAGRNVSERLQQHAGAKIKEFPGPHAFYFDIPDEFVEYLLQALEVLL